MSERITGVPAVPKFTFLNGREAQMACNKDVCYEIKIDNKFNGELNLKFGERDLTRFCETAIGRNLSNQEVNACVDTFKLPEKPCVGVADICASGETALPIKDGQINFGDFSVNPYTVIDVLSSLSTNGSEALETAKADHDQAVIDAYSPCITPILIVGSVGVLGLIGYRTLSWIRNKIDDRNRENAAQITESRNRKRALKAAIADEAHNQEMAKKGNGGRIESLIPGIISSMSYRADQISSNRVPKVDIESAIRESAINHGNDPDKLVSEWKSYKNAQNFDISANLSAMEEGQIYGSRKEVTRDAAGRIVQTDLLTAFLINHGVMPGDPRAPVDSDYDRESYKAAHPQKRRFKLF
jgi:hypothetical protein